jgi:hypothetical protein
MHIGFGECDGPCIECMEASLFFIEVTIPHCLAFHFGIWFCELLGSVVFSILWWSLTVTVAHFFFRSI